MKRGLERAIMTLSKLKNKLFKDRTESNKKYIAKKEIFVLTSCTKLKKQYYSKLEVSSN